MFPLLLTTVTSASFALIVRDAQHRHRNALTVGMINYLVAATVYGLVVATGGGFHPRPATAIIAIVGGAVFGLTYFILCSALRERGASVSAIALRLAVLIPVVCSALFWGEFPSARQALGVLLCLVALPLLGLDRNGKEAALGGRGMALMFLLFLLSGGCQLVVKTFVETKVPGDQAVFFFIVFCTSFLVISVAWALDRDGSSLRDAISGVPLGLCNVLSNWFLLIALQTLPGTIVFPFYNTAGLLLASAFAALVWRERLGRLGKAGMVLAAIAVVLLN